MNKKVNIQVDASKRCGTQEHLWRWIGYDECNYTYIPEGKELLRSLQPLGMPPIISGRILCSAQETATGRINLVPPIYIGKIPRGIRFMISPIMTRSWILIWKQAISTLWSWVSCLRHWWMKNTCCPKRGIGTRYNQYKDVAGHARRRIMRSGGNFIKALISHLLERYGEEEVKTWYFELWNEPDIFYWNGTIAEYCKQV